MSQTKSHNKSNGYSKSSFYFDESKLDYFDDFKLKNRVKHLRWIEFEYFHSLQWQLVDDQMK